MYLPSLTDKELVAYADQTQDPLTTSELENELAKRLELRVYAGHDEIIDILSDRFIDTAEELKAFFDKLDTLKEKAEEL